MLHPWLSRVYLLIDGGSPQCFTFAGSGDRAVLKCNPIYLADRIQDMFCDVTRHDITSLCCAVCSGSDMEWVLKSEKSREDTNGVSFVLCQIGKLNLLVCWLLCYITLS